MIKDSFDIRNMTVMLVVMLVFLNLGISLWLTTGKIMALFLLGYKDISVGLGLSGRDLLRERQTTPNFEMHNAKARF